LNPSERAVFAQEQAQAEADDMDFVEGFVVDDDNQEDEVWQASAQMLNLKPIELTEVLCDEMMEWYEVC